MSSRKPVALTAKAGKRSKARAKVPGPPVDPKRSALMARVRQAGTKPEILVWEAAKQLGLAMLRNVRRLPGSPDIVFPASRKAIFVHGCFWHRHPGCARTTTPKTRAMYWQEKFRANRLRDARARAALRRLGWKSMVVWECQTVSEGALRARLRRFLERQ
jgi:DNA mismatch endonuclease, patch repair protein